VPEPGSACRCGRLRRQCRGGAADRRDHGNLSEYQIGGQRRQPLVISLRPAVFDCDIPALDETRPIEALTECGHDPVTKGSVIKGLSGLTSTAKRAAPGSSSCKSPSRFAASSTPMSLIPVRLPPGRLRLATRPIFTGSAPMTKTMGIVAVAALAASVAGVLAGVTMTATRRRTSSAASAGRRSL
jgi:hypothetical protein